MNEQMVGTLGPVASGVILETRLVSWTASQ